MNFLELCERNREYLSSAFEDLLSRAEPAAHAALSTLAASAAEHGRLGVNMRPTVLQDFLIMDRWFNIYAWAQKISSRAGKPVEELLRARLGPYFERRMAFDGTFESGLEFRYGALNIGGLGARRFGEYCAIFRSEALPQSAVGYLKGDSLNHYMAPGPKVDTDRLRTDCAPESAKHMLLALKHGSDAPATPENRWPELVCNADCYVEAIVVHGEVKASHLGGVRIDRLDYAWFWEHTFLEFDGRLPELDRYRLDAFASIDERLQVLGISWETV